jgi:glutamine amidotransferase PdxT
MPRIGLDTVIQERAQAGMPLYGTCAGMILLAKGIEDRPTN